MKTINKNKQQKQQIIFTNISKEWQYPKQSKLTFVDVFSGAGGITQGFIQAGLKPIAGLDFYKEAV